jgi:hypothetical protein
MTPMMEKLLELQRLVGHAMVWKDDHNSLCQAVDLLEDIIAEYHEPVTTFDPANMSRMFQTGMIDRPLVEIQYISGFERFGAYETWDQGWVIKGRGMIKSDFLVSSNNSDFDKAWREWKRKYEAALRLESRGEELDHSVIIDEANKS